MVQSSCITLKDISKKYNLYDSHFHRLKEALFGKKYHREFWALKNINFEIKRGQTVGIIGMNGSGKSTLLQIICSILQPTSGHIHVEGRVAALIELGAGFSPDLTGRENAKLNLVLMGLPLKKVKETIEEVEKFADIGDFFDQPVKTYSSGMFARLAFGTAINVDPDILIIDEALAVGDAKFQQKCFKRFEAFREMKKTIILVTHDRFTIPRLCDVGILLHKGELLNMGNPKEICDQYSLLLSEETKPIAHKETMKKDAKSIAGPEDVGSFDPLLEKYEFLSRSKDMAHMNPTYNKYHQRSGTGEAIILDYAIITEEGLNPVSIESGSEITIAMNVKYNEFVKAPIVGFGIKDTKGTIAFTCNTVRLGLNLSSRHRGEVCSYIFKIRLDLNAGDWFIDLAVAGDLETLLDDRQDIVHLRVWSKIHTYGIAYLKSQALEVLQPTA